jgi:hypothetical protein
MKAVRQFGIVILLLVSYMTPATACMVSTVQMNAQERACCRTMQNQCGQMDMPSSHGCCQKTSPGAQNNAIVTKATANHPVGVVAIWMTAAADWTRPDFTAARQFAHAEYSPPHSPPGTVSVLRI